MTEQKQKPYFTIDDVNVYVEDLPDEGQQIFGRLQRLNQKKAAQTLDLEETQGAINFFSSKIVEIVNEDKSGVKEEESETKEVPSDTETQDS